MVTGKQCQVIPTLFVMPEFRADAEDRTDAPTASLSYSGVLAFKMELLDLTLLHLRGKKDKMSKQIFVELGKCLNRKMSAKQREAYVMKHGCMQFMTRKSQKYDLQSAFDVMKARLNDLGTIDIKGLAPFIWVNDTGGSWTVGQVPIMDLFFKTILDPDNKKRAGSELVQKVAAVFHDAAEKGDAVKFA